MNKAAKLLSLCNTLGNLTQPGGRIQGPFMGGGGNPIGSIDFTLVQAAQDADDKRKKADKKLKAKLKGKELDDKDIKFSPRGFRPDADSA